MKKRYPIVLLCASFMWVWGSCWAQGDDSLSDYQKSEIEQLIEEYLISNPEIILESVQKYRERQEAEKREEGANALQARREDLERNPYTPVVGNPGGDVTIVEFFDYNCGYCKSVLATVRQILVEDSGVRLVLKEYPILSEDSEFAARAALAAKRQGRYFDFHNALMGVRGQVSKETVLEVASKMGLDVAKLREDMNDKNIDVQIESNRELAQSLNINGTPTFVVGDRIIPGAVDGDTLRELIEKNRING